MPGESPAKWQAQAHRFGVRRLETAVSSGDPLLGGDLRRKRLNVSQLVSFIIAALILGGFAVYGFVRPEPKIGDAAVVIDSDTGGVFVARDGRLYPAMNLSSALLAAGRGSSNTNAPKTTTVDTTTVGKTPRGPLLGISGAPDVLPRSSELVRSQWTVCDDTTINTVLAPDALPTVRTTAIIGEKVPSAGSLATTSALLVSADNGATTFLMWHGRRSKIDTKDDTIRLALGLGPETTARPISAALLNVIPEAPDLDVPAIARPDVEPPYATALGIQVGDVFALERADRTHALYVALPGGVQPITALVGDLIRDEFDVRTSIPLVAPRLLRQSPHAAAADSIDTKNYPATRPNLDGVDRFPVTCVARSGAGVTTEVFALDRVPIPGGAKPVTVTQPADLTVDAVYIHPGDGAVLSAATQTQPSGARALYVVTDGGVAYPVVSSAALSYLGFGSEDQAKTAPELISLLPQGPTLDPNSAAQFYPQTGASAGSLPPATATGGGGPGG